MRVSKHGHQARGRLARGRLIRGCYHARRTRDHGFAAGFFLPAAHPKPARARRPRSYLVGRAILRQGLPCPAPPARSPCARRAAAVIPGKATVTTMRRPKAAGPGSKRWGSKGASGLLLPTWPTPRPVSPTISTTTITNACTSVSAIRPLITLPNNCFILLP